MSILLATIAGGSFTACVFVTIRPMLGFKGAYAPAFDTSHRR